MPCRAFFAICLLLLSASAVPLRSQEVTIYRCVDAKGNLALRDSPCAKGETQQVRSMQRPKDPAPGTAIVQKPAPAPEAPRTVREVQVIYRTPPRPLYECVTPDGDRYTSENGEGNPRSVPLWTLGVPVWSHRGGQGERPPGGPKGQVRGGYPGGGVAYTVVRDECHALPQQEVCARLSDRRYEIIRRYNSALQSERRQLEQEQRGVEARMDQDCGDGR